MLKNDVTLVIIYKTSLLQLGVAGWHRDNCTKEDVATRQVTLTGHKSFIPETRVYTRKTLLHR